MISSSVFDLTVNAFEDFVNEVFSGTDVNQKAKLRTKLNKFSKINKSEGKSSVRGRSPKIDRTDLDRGCFKSTRPRSTFRSKIRPKFDHFFHKIDSISQKNSEIS